MDRALLRVLTCLLIGLAASCSSDDDDASMEAPVEADASVAVDGGDDRRGSKPSSSDGGGCDDLTCKAPATCSESSGRARCACPEGYEDKNEDGSECEQTELCSAAQRRECGEKQCIIGGDGPKCVCMAPAYVPDGDGCKCGEGYTENKDGLCLANDGQACEDDLDCSNEQCVGGICCANSCESPEEACRTSKGATCADGKTCKYALAEDGAACEDDNACVIGDTCKAGKCESGKKEATCDDNNPCTDDSCDMAVGCRNQNNTSTCDDSNACTSEDACIGGICTGGTTKECPNDEADSCNEAKCDPGTGECGYAAVPDGKLCDDDSSCTLTDQCMAGSCTGQGNACGPNATECSPDEPNMCECAPDYRESDGKCVPEDDECEDDPCSSNAECFDPSNGPDDVTCTCDPGYVGDGRTCNEVDACATNPCGTGGTCESGAPGEYTCDCDDGYVNTGSSCSCSLTGTFVIRSRTEIVWRDLDGIADGRDISDDWAIAKLDYDAEGKLEIDLTPCGSTTPDLCGEGAFGVVQPEAYGQYLLQNIWGKPSMPVTHIEMDIPNAAPGAAFETPQVVALLGIALDDPRGPWPGSRRDIAGGPDFDGSAVNGARWTDIDDDGSVGLTNYVVPPGGVSIDGSGPDPLVAYSEESTNCDLPYAYLPAQDGLTVRRVKRVYTGTRFINAYVGKIESCDRIEGDLIGPDGAELAFETRFGGCVRTNGDGETPCNAAVTDFLETGGEGQKVDSAKFIMKRVSNDISCTQARAESFD